MTTPASVPQNTQVDHVSPVVKEINNLLNSSKTRIEGLQLLSFFLRRCRDEDFLQFCISWMQNCCKVDSLRKNRNLSPRVLRSLLELSSNYPELKKSVSFFITTRYFNFFLKHFPNSPSGWCCTEACLFFYKGACGPFQEVLEKQLQNEIEKNEKISPIVAGCVALLPSIGGGGKEGANYKRNWKSQYVKFLNTCHSILNGLFADVEEFQVQENETADHVSCKGDGMEKNINYLTIQLFNCSTVLCCMLLNQYPTPKNVPSDLSFHLICRGLAVLPRTLEKLQTAAAISRQKVLPDIHCSLLSLLKALIVSCKNQLLPYSQLICKLIKQSLECDFDSGSGEQSEHLRVLAYEAFCGWLAVAKNGSCAETISDVVVSAAIGDIRPKKGVVFLKEGKLQERSKSRESKTGRVKASSKLRHAALKSLQFLLKFTGVLLKPEVHQLLQEVVVKLLVEVQRSVSRSDRAPLAAAPCRAGLYSVLLELIRQPSPLWSPPTSFAARLFSRGLNDSSPAVSSFCSAALNFTTLIIHPQYDNGGFGGSGSTPNRGRTGMTELRSAEECVDAGREAVESSGDGFLARREENSADPNAVDPPEKLGHVNEETDISSGEDSNNTVTFPKDAVDFARSTFGEREVEPTEEESSQPRQGEISEAEPRRGDILSPERCPTPRGTPRSRKTTKIRESNRTNDSDGSNSISPASTPEDGHKKGRYFLRSKAKGSSEEPEEALRTNSPESTKCTLGKNCEKVTPKKRPRTRALSKAEESGDSEEKSSAKHGHFDDEEDVRASFDDFFID